MTLSLSRQTGGLRYEGFILVKEGWKSKAVSEERKSFIKVNGDWMFKRTGAMD